jgi:TonB dependent receptor
LSQAGNPGSFLVPSLPGNPAYRSVWTAAFDSNRNGVADFVEPTLGLPAVPGAQPPVFADQNCLSVAAQDPKVVPAIAAAVPSPIGTIPIGLCQFDFGGFYSIVPEETRTSAFTEVIHEFGDNLQGRFEAHVANNEARRNNSPSFPFAAFPTVAATHPDNPYGSDVRFIGRIIGAGGVPIESIHNSDTWRIAGSLTGTVDNTWVWEVGAQYSENDFFVSAPDVLVDRFNNAIRGFGGAGCNPTTGTRGVAPCAYFNPFGSALTGTGTRNSPELLSHLVGFENFDAHSELVSLEGFASRELGELGGGFAAIAFGTQYRGDELRYDYNEDANRDNFLFLVGNPDFGDDRDVEAVFVELALPFTETLNLQLAGRYESYGDGVDSTDPKATLLWRPTLELSVRASVGTAFRAPSLFQVFGTQTTLGELIDPNVGSPQFFPVRTQPNPSGAQLQAVLSIDGHVAVDLAEERRALANVDLVVDVGIDVANERIDAVPLVLPADKGVGPPLGRRRAEVRKVAPARAVDGAGLRVLEVVARDQRRVRAHRQRAAARKLEVTRDVEVEAVGLERGGVGVERVDAQQQAAGRVADHLRSCLHVALRGGVQERLRVLLDDHVRIVVRPIVDANLPVLGRRETDTDVPHVGFLGSE